MESRIPNNTFCPDNIFTKLDTYITQVQILDNIQVSNQRKILSRTLGQVSILEKVGQKKIEIIKDELTLYSAEKKKIGELLKIFLIANKFTLSNICLKTKSKFFLNFIVVN